MNSELYTHSIRHLVYQRNAFFILTLALSISTILLVVLLFWKSERIVVVPPVVEKEFWVDSNNVSPTYLEQMGLFLGNLLLSKSSASAPSQRDILLKHTDSGYYSTLKKKLDQEMQKLSAENASYVFFPSIVQLNHSNEILLEGERKTYVGDKIVSSDREGYVLSYKILGSRMLLTGVTTKDVVK